MDTVIVIGTGINIMYILPATMSQHIYVHRTAIIRGLFEEIVIIYLWLESGGTIIECDV